MSYLDTTMKPTIESKIVLHVNSVKIIIIKIWKDPFISNFPNVYKLYSNFIYIQHTIYIKHFRINFFIQIKNENKIKPIKVFINIYSVIPISNNIIDKITSIPQGSIYIF